MDIISSPAPWIRVSRRYIPVELLTRLPPYLVAWCVLSIGLVVGAHFYFSQYFALAEGVLSILSLALLIRATIFVFLDYRNHLYSEGPDELFTAHGRFYHSVRVTPYGRIQNITIYVGPLQRILGLCSLSVHTAGAHSTVHIENLTDEVATALRARLTQAAETRAIAL